VQRVAYVKNVDYLREARSGWDCRVGD
jgi:hypothetical protein